MSSRLRGAKTLKVTGFLNEFEKDDVKKQLKITSLFASFGVALEKKGSSFMGLCPFHNDKTPSLSVDNNKGLFHCFGCGASGDIFDLVGKIKGFDFQDSLKFLKGFDDKASGSKIPKPLFPVSSQETGVEPAVVEREEPTLTLNDITDYYHKRIFESPGAKDYLTRRGLFDPSIIRKFKIGFCDGTLIEKTSKVVKGELVERGILNKKSKEHFEGCITIPLTNKSGEVVQCYGRSIKANTRVKHLYLKGSNSGFLNLKAASVYSDEIILTESIIDALSLYTLGLQNVIPCYGVNGFTDNHLKLLTENMVKRIVIAFDNDKAGKQGSDTLRKRLLTSGFKVKILTPKLKDWNEDLLSGRAKEDIENEIKALQIFTPEKKPAEEFEASKDGAKHRFLIAGISYRLLGVKDSFVANLRVNIRAERDKVRYLDNVDLYSARSRAIFAGNLSRLFDIESGRIEKDLIRIVEHLEAERDRNFLTTEDRPISLSEEEQQLGMELLKSPNLFDRIVEDTETLGYVGEDLNKQLIYLAASSRKLDDPVSVIVISQSAAGKSYLIDTVKKLIPPEDVVSMTSLSDQALNYLPERGLINKFLVMGEAVHSESVEHQLREMLSSHELSRLVTTKDEKTGELVSKRVRKEVIVSAVMSSASYDINQENASRSFVINTDETLEQTQRIHLAQRDKYSLKRFKLKKKTIPEIIKQHHCAQRLLEKRVIINPLAKHISFPDNLMRSRRDHERFIDLIASVCFLRQFQKELKLQDQVEYIECDLEDYKTAYKIMKQILPSTLSNFPKSAIALYEEIRKMTREKAGKENLRPEEVSVKQREIREKTGHNQMFVKRYMKVLVDYEFIRRSGTLKSGSRNSYAIFFDEPVRLVDIEMILSPDAMGKLLAKKS